MDDQFLELLANPNDPERSPLVRKVDYLVCSKTGVGFPIVDGIPQLLPENEIPADKMKELLNK
jgi:uncharacterized protein YbaR (Trm112 family)